MSIQNNIESLQYILESVNTLPDQSNAAEVNLQNKTITPNAGGQVVYPDSGYTGLSQVTINGDSDLIASNIRSGKNIFGVNGTMTEGVTVQRKSGTFDAASGTAYNISCGFIPDLVMLHTNETWSGEILQFAVAFYEDSRKGRINNALFNPNGDQSNIYIRTWDEGGFHLTIYHTYGGNRTFYYTAVKYT